MFNDFNMLLIASMMYISVSMFLFVCSISMQQASARLTENGPRQSSGSGYRVVAAMVSDVVAWKSLDTNFQHLPAYLRLT